MAAEAESDEAETEGSADRFNSGKKNKKKKGKSSDETGVNKDQMFERMNTVMEMMVENQRSTSTMIGKYLKQLCRSEKSSKDKSKETDFTSSSDESSNQCKGSWSICLQPNHVNSEHA